MNVYLVKRNPRRSKWQIWHVEQTPSDEEPWFGFVGDYPTQKQARVVASILAGHDVPVIGEAELRGTYETQFPNQI